MLRLEHVCVRWSLSVCVGVCVCVCVRERERERERERDRERQRDRGASVTQQPSLSIRPSLARLHATHASTRTF